MFDKFTIDMKKVYPTLVISTMSSGKSTLINSLVGKELLPSQNRACTAKTVAILDHDGMDDFQIHAVDENGSYTNIKKATKKAVYNYNATNNVEEMILEGDIRGIKNSKKAMLLIDTPGVNNSMDQTHAEITRETLDEYQEGLILYVINAQQIGTYDDNNFLTYIAKKLNNNKKFNILFVINKMDLIDYQKEDPQKLVKNCKEYIESKGIKDPILIPLSASGALIFKKVLNGESLSEVEEENFTKHYKHFRRQGFSLTDYIEISELGDMQDVFCVEGKKYTRAEILAALYNTGITILENKIDELLVFSLKLKAPEISVKSVYRMSKEMLLDQSFRI